MDGLRIVASARKWRVPDEDIEHAWENALRFRLIEYDGEERLLVVGPSRSGRMLNSSLYLLTPPRASSTRTTCNPTESTT